VAAESLLGAGDLPPGATAGISPATEPCGPLPILADGGAETGASPLFEFGQVRLKEAVGVFSGTGPAVAAFDALNTEQRRDCIHSALEELGDGPGSLVPLPPRRLGVADDDSLVRFLEPGTESPHSVDVVSIRSGRCVASLIFQASSTATVLKMSATAAGLLADACR
jgi:hypothetical protein